MWNTETERRRNEREIRSERAHTHTQTHTRRRRDTEHGFQHAGSGLELQGSDPSLRRVFFRCPFRARRVVLRPLGGQGRGVRSGVVEAREGAEQGLEGRRKRRGGEGLDRDPRRVWRENVWRCCAECQHGHRTFSRAKKTTHVLFRNVVPGVCDCADSERRRPEVWR